MLEDQAMMLQSTPVCETNIQELQSSLLPLIYKLIPSLTPTPLDPTALSTMQEDVSVGLSTRPECRVLDRTVIPRTFVPAPVPPPAPVYALNPGGSEGRGEEGGGETPFGVGRGDLDPFSAGPMMDPFSGGGMMVGPGHPMFGGGQLGPYVGGPGGGIPGYGPGGIPGRTEPGGGGSLFIPPPYGSPHVPPMAAPQGKLRVPQPRFDPYGPVVNPNIDIGIPDEDDPFGALG
jgi:hypothetical protein